MVQFLVKRLVGLLFVILGVTFLTFIIGYFAPGDPVLILMGDRPNPALAAQLRHQYGLDLPWFEQYWRFLTGMLRFDFGTSFDVQDRPVIEIIREGMLISAELGFWALLIQVGVGVPVGIFSALRANSWLDTLNMGTALVVYALPSFILALFAQLLIVWIDQTFNQAWPSTQWGAPWSYTWDDLQFKIVPILVYGATGMAYFSRLARTSMLEVLRQDYIRTARAKGLYEKIVIYRHAFRNALIPLITVIGLAMGFLVAGAFFIERQFQINGIARITLESINNLDYPVVQAVTMILAVFVVTGNLISDILYTVVDPRIKAE